MSFFFIFILFLFFILYQFIPRDEVKNKLNLSFSSSFFIFISSCVCYEESIFFFLFHFQLCLLWSVNIEGPNCMYQFPKKTFLKSIRIFNLILKTFLLWSVNDRSAQFAPISSRLDIAQIYSMATIPNENWYFCLSQKIESVNLITEINIFIHLTKV